MNDDTCPVLWHEGPDQAGHTTTHLCVLPSAHIHHRPAPQQLQPTPHRCWCDAEQPVRDVEPVSA